MKLEITLWEIINERIRIRRPTGAWHPRKLAKTAQSRSGKRFSSKTRRNPLRRVVLPLCYDI